MPTLRYERRGSGAPLVLLHGFPLDRSIWRALLPHLEAHFDLIAPDLRGFGESAALEPASVIEDYAADLNNLLGALNLSRAFLAGHSMGGYVALAFARRYGEKLLGLGLIASQALPDSPEKRNGRYTSIEQIRAQGMEVLAGMAEKLSANPEHAPLLRDITLRQQPEATAAALRAMAERPDSTALLPNLHIPLVLVHGDADGLIPIQRAREIKTLIPSARLTELRGVGHMPMLEAPQETARALLDAWNAPKL
jgi:pimeloyl-ACP methyl ester carboxylesterase